MSVAEKQHSKSPGGEASGPGRSGYGHPVDLRRDPTFLAGALSLAALAVAFPWGGQELARWLGYFGGPAILLTLSVFALVRAAAATRRAPEKRFWRLLAGAFTCWWVTVVFASPLEPRSDVRDLLADAAYAGFYALLIVAVETRPHRRLEGTTGPLEQRLMAPAAGFLVVGWLIYFSMISVAYGLRTEESVVPSLLLFSLLDLYWAGRLMQLARRAVGGWRSIYGWLAAAAFGFLATDLYAVFEQVLALDPRWDRWQNALFFLPMALVVGAARLGAGGPRSSTMLAPQSPIVRPLPTVLWAFSFPVLHAALELTGWLAPAGHRPRELVVVAMVAILGAYAVFQRQLLVRHSLELWRQGRRVERELKASEQDLLLMVARGHQQQELERHEQTYQKAFQASPDALLLTSWSDGRVLEANQSFFEMMATSREEVIGTLTRDLPLWPRESLRRRVLQQVLDDGPLHVPEVVIRGTGGATQRVELSLDRVETKEGRLLLSVFRRLDLLSPDGDVDRRGRWSTVLEAADKGLVAVDRGGEVILANAAAGRALGLTSNVLWSSPWDSDEHELPTLLQMSARDDRFLLVTSVHDD
ncbi:MAG: PAS domain-containing protein [Acidobacteriota bacterium]